MNNKLKWFIYASLLFLCLYLFNSGYLILPEIYSASYLTVSFVLLIFGFFLHSYTSKVLVNSYKLECSFKEMYVAYGLSLLGKYIPGKVFLLLGRAYYLKQKKGYSTSKLSTIFFNGQLLEILVGILLGISSFAFASGLEKYLLPATILFLLLCFFVFSPFLHRWAEKAIKKILKREMVLPSLNLNQIIKAFPIMLATWLCWGLAYAFFVSALSEASFSFSFSFSFILAVSLGVLAIIFPGGMGVRETVLTVFLISMGIEKEVAITIAVCSRIWFLIGELFVFVSALVMRKRV